MAHGHKPDEKVVFVGDSRVRKYNKDHFIPHDFTAYPGKSEVFIPNFLLKEWMVGAVILVGILSLVMSDPAPLGYPADPTNTTFIPMPDWYFLFMYQLLKYPYTSGIYKLMGTLVIPAIMFGALTIAPFLDTGKERRFYRRPITSALMIVSLIACSYLTVFSWHHYTKELADKGIIPETKKREEEYEAARKKGEAPPDPTKKAAAIPIQAKDDPGYTLYQKASCVQCHQADLKGMPAAKIPQLLGVGDKYDKAKILDIIKNGKDNIMPPQYDNLTKSGFSDADVDKLANWLSLQKASK